MISLQQVNFHGLSFRHLSQGISYSSSYCRWNLFFTVMIFKMSKTWPNYMGEFVFIVKKDSTLLSNVGKFIFNWTGNGYNMCIYLCAVAYWRSAIVRKSH